MNREKIYTYFFLLLVALFGLATLVTLFPFLTPILWAIVLGMVIYPAHMYTSRLLKSRTLSAFVMTLLVFLFIVIPFGVVSFISISQLLDLSRKVIEYFQTHSVEDTLKSLRELPILSKYLTEEKIAPLVEYVQRQEFRNLLINALNKFVAILGNKLGEAAFIAGRNVFYVFVFILTFFFILRDGLPTMKRLERLIPMDRQDTVSVLNTIYRTVLAVVYGSIGTAFIQSMLAMIAYSVVGIKFFLLWSVLTFFAAFIPPFGTAAVWVPLTIYTFFNIGLWQAVFLAAWGTFLISAVDNFVRPLIMKRGIEIPYIVLFFSTIGGLLKFGFIGLFIGPIAFTTLFSLIKIYEKKVIGNSDT